MRALSPAKPTKIIIDDENGKALAVISDEQISLAIGKGGQNRRLASKLTGYEIDTIKETEYQDILSEEKGDQLDLTKIEGLRPSILNKLIAEGFETVEDVLKGGYDGLIKISGIADKTAKKILDTLNNI